MKNALPWICLVACLFAVLAMPWRRTDPHHDFIFSLLHQLEGDAENIDASPLSAAEAAPIGHRTAPHNPDRHSRARV